MISMKFVKYNYISGPDNIYQFDFEGCVIETAQKVTKERTAIELKKNSITSALSGRTTYKVTVKTANEARAGTDDRVFVQIHGDSGVTPREELKGTWIRNEFEKNQVDNFQGKKIRLQRWWGQV